MNGFNMNHDPFGYGPSTSGANSQPCSHTDTSGKTMEAAGAPTGASISMTAYNHAMGGGVGAYGSAHDSYNPMQQQNPGVPVMQYYQDPMTGQMSYGLLQSAAASAAPSPAGGDCNGHSMHANGGTTDYGSVIASPLNNRYSLSQPQEQGYHNQHRHPSSTNLHMNSTSYRLSQHQQYQTQTTHNQQHQPQKSGNSQSSVDAARATLCGSPPPDSSIFDTIALGSDVGEDEENPNSSITFFQSDSLTHNIEQQQLPISSITTTVAANPSRKSRIVSNDPMKDGDLKLSSKQHRGDRHHDDGSHRKHKRPKKHHIKERVHDAKNNSNSNNGKKDLLSNFKLTISSLSLEPLTGVEVVDRVQVKTNEVTTRYLPCVDLLVACQQDLRAGLNIANQRTRNGRSRMSTSQFYKNYLEPLPRQFYQQNQNIMPCEELKEAYAGILSLLSDAKKVEHSGKCEGMKNAFLGGMRDGESWGLRKWLSKNGGALQICNDLELILGAIRQLPKEAETTKLLAKKIQPEAKRAFHKLKNDVPSAYQEVSSAHPYLPFFHRLESALKGLHEFDPENDDVICLDSSSDDDDSVEIITSKPVAKPRKRNKTQQDNDLSETDGGAIKRAASGCDSPAFFQALLEDHDGSDTDRIFNDNDSITGLVSYKNPNQERQRGSDSFGNASFSPTDEIGNFSTLQQEHCASSEELVQSVEKVVNDLESGQDLRPLKAQKCDDFWSNPTSNYVIILRLFQEILRKPASRQFLNPIHLNEYVELVKHPLCFRDIVVALSEENDQKKGDLECSSLKKWNMFEGSKLIQAVDLVFLNVLVYMKQNQADDRKGVLKLRALFWDKIKRYALNDKKNIPTKRVESSSFVLRNKR